MKRRQRARRYDQTANALLRKCCDGRNSRLVAARNVADFKATRRGGESKYQVATAIVVSDCMAP